MSLYINTSVRRSSSLLLPFIIKVGCVLFAIFSSSWTACPLKTGWIVCPETSVAKYQLTPHTIPEERRPVYCLWGTNRGGRNSWWSNHRNWALSCKIHNSSTIVSLIKADYNLFLRYRSVKNIRISVLLLKLFTDLQSTGNNSERALHMWLTVRLSDGYCHFESRVVWRQSRNCDQVIVTLLHKAEYCLTTYQSLSCSTNWNPKVHDLVHKTLQLDVEPTESRAHPQTMYNSVSSVLMYQAYDMIWYDMTWHI
jgi:hypothetical protein